MIVMVVTAVSGSALVLRASELLETVSARLATAAAAAVEAGATLAVTEVVAAAPSVTLLLLLVVAVDDARSLAASFTSREAEAGEPRAF